MPLPALGALGMGALRAAGKVLMNPYVGGVVTAGTLLGVNPMDLAAGAETEPDALEAGEALEQETDAATQAMIEPPKVDIERIPTSGHVRISIPDGVDAGELEATLAMFTAPMVSNYKGKKQKIYTLTAREYERIRGGM